MATEAQIAELELRRKWAEGLGGEEAVKRHHERGSLTVRERIAGVIDQGSFQEIGKLAGKGSYGPNNELLKVMPNPYVMGLAKVNGRPVAIGGEDYTVRGGVISGNERRKGGRGSFVEDIAYEYRIPLINLIDGAGGTVESIRTRGFTAFPGSGPKGFERSVELLSRVPVVCAVMGTAAGSSAARAVLGHWSVMVKDSSQIFAAGPPVVERASGEKTTKEELGGPKVAVDLAGTIDNVAKDEVECFQMIKRFMSYMPQNVWELPPVHRIDDPVDRRDEALLSSVPSERRAGYDMRRIIRMIVDRDSTFEIQPTFGKGVITCFARLNGYVVGIIANNPLQGGVMDVKATRKQGHFIDLCDTFHIPIIYFVDVPGVTIGLKAESDAVLREGMRAAMIGMQATVPSLTLVIRRCYGMAGMATRDRDGLDFKIAWPSAEWGSLPIQGGVAAAYRREIENAPDPDARLKEIEAELSALSSPFRTAEAFAVEDVIDPRETRPYLCGLIDALQGRMKTELGPKPRYGVRP